MDSSEDVGLIEMPQIVDDFEAGGSRKLTGHELTATSDSKAHRGHFKRTKTYFGAPLSVTTQHSDKTAFLDDQTAVQLQQAEKIEPNPRGHWGNEMQFLLACMGYAIGLGNIWRFPYLTYKYGGGTFLVPYIFCLFAIGLPVFYMEMAIGQYTSLGANGVFDKMAPLFRGIGWASLSVTLFVSIYYNIILAWAIVYFGDCLYRLFTSQPLSFTSCSNPYNSERCWSDLLLKACHEKHDKRYVFYNGSCHEPTNVTFNAETNLPNKSDHCQNWLTKLPWRTGNLNHSKLLDCQQLSTNPNQYQLDFNIGGIFDGRGLTHAVDQIIQSLNLTTNLSAFFDQTDLFTTAQYNYETLVKFNMTNLPSEEYFNYFIYDFKTAVDSSSELGAPQWGLVLANAISWSIVFLCVMSGVKSIQKIVYVTVVFPLIMIVVFIIRGLTLPGMAVGVKYYLSPRIEHLWNVETWMRAASQIAFSLSIAQGGLMAMASYNHFHNNFYKHSIIVPIANCMTSFIAGFAVFPVLGFLATEQGLTVDKVVKYGPSLIFVAFPEAIARMPGSAFWLILFLLMIYMLGLDSQFTYVETISTALSDQHPLLQANKRMTTAIVCVCLYLAGMPACCARGLNYFNVLDDMSANFALLIIMFVETSVLVYCYGLSRLCHDIQMMLGVKHFFGSGFIGPTGWYWRITWSFAVPAGSLFLIVYTTTQFEYLKDAFEDVPLHWGYQTFGWVLTLTPIWIIFGLALKEIINAIVKSQPWRTVLLPTPLWGTARHRYHLQEQIMHLTDTQMPGASASNTQSESTQDSQRSVEF